MGNKKDTDMRSNQRVKLIDPDIDDKKEDNLKVHFIETYQEYINEQFKRNGEIKGTMSQ